MVGVNTMIISYQNAEIFTHIKGRLLERAVILINCVPFQNSNFSESKEFAPSGSEFSSLRRVPYVMEIQYYHIRRFPLNCTIFITLLRTCVMGATPMGKGAFWWETRSVA